MATKCNNEVVQCIYEGRMEVRRVYSERFKSIYWMGVESAKNGCMEWSYGWGATVRMVYSGI